MSKYPPSFSMGAGAIMATLNNFRHFATREILSHMGVTLGLSSTIDIAWFGQA